MSAPSGMKVSSCGVDTNEDMGLPGEDRFRAMAEHAAELVLIVEPEGTISFVAPSVRAILGHEAAELTGRRFLELVNHQDLQRAETLLFDLLAHAGKVASVELILGHASGSPRHFELTLNNLTAEPSVAGIVVTGRDVTERKVMEQELSHQAFHDPLTNLANRALFRNRVEHALARTARDARPVVVMFLDLDDFKTINDSLGHASGDLVLFEVARRLRASLRRGDTAARLGGDEFGIMLEPEAQHDVPGVAERILEVLTPPLVVQEKEVSLAASIGIAVSSGPDDSAEEMLRNADVAMYAAKAHGKGRYEIFEPRMHHSAVERLELQADLKHAIDNGELFLHYQPVVSLSDGTIAAVEALVRWQHPRRGVVAPAGFIGVAEESGLIVPLGRWVLAEACRQAKEWRAVRPSDPISVSVNVSAAELRREDFVDHLASVLDATGLDPGLLVLELTESTLMRDADGSGKRLRALRQLGVRLAMDDFGTGYSSLSYLKKFPMDVLKIDSSFVQGLDKGPEESAIARAIVQIGRTLRMQTVAEGIETGEDVARLAALGCDYGQGFYLSRPMPAEKLTMLLRFRDDVFGVSVGRARSLQAPASV
jgi:diguanylate cyclase (GGDEF)-like protein/PAS domain S-box-containing protein